MRKVILFTTISFLAFVIFVNTAGGAEQAKKAFKKNVTPDTEKTIEIKKNSFTYTPSKPTVGQVVTVKIVIKSNKALKNLLIVGGVKKVHIYYNKSLNWTEGRQRNISFQWTPNKAGDYVLYFKIDPSNEHGLKETITKGISISEGKPDKPDLIITEIGSELNPVEDGSLTNLGCEFKNVGSDFKKNWAISLFLDGKLLHYQVSYGLKTGEKGFAVKVFQIKGVGKHTANCMLDPGNDIDESNENNNTKSYEFTVTEASSEKPDLVIDKFYLDPSPSVEEGKTVKMNCHFRNNGGELKGTWYQSYYVDGKLVYKVRWGDIPAGGYRNPWAPWTATSVDVHILQCRLDSDGDITESDETNNERIVSIAVRSK